MQGRLQFRQRESQCKGNYLSYAYNIDIESREQMEQTYAALKDVPGLKFAL